jgi:hypothetical protein
MFFAAGITLIATHPRIVLVVLAYSYLASAFVGMAVSKLRHRDGSAAPTEAHAPPEDADRQVEPRDTAAR